MSGPDERDPVAASADRGADLYDVAYWEERTSLDGLAVGLYRLVVAVARLVVLLTALGILLGIGALSVVGSPQLRVLTLLSALPALALAGYIWYSDVTESEPLSTLVATFLLGVLMANFAAVLNSLLQPAFGAVGPLGMVLFFFVVVGPVEESVKLLAVRFHAYRTATFDAVIDGAVYGAVAGLGFATIENALFISREITAAGDGTVTALAAVTNQIGIGLIGAGGGITVIRALAGPGHVIYSAFAGYYLGLAKFNPEHRGPIVVKGLLIATVIHAIYNSTVGVGSFLLSQLPLVGDIAGFLLFVLLYDGLFGYLLYRKIRRYRDAYYAAHDGGVEDAGEIEDAGTVEDSREY